MAPPVPKTDPKAELKRLDPFVAAAIDAAVLGLDRKIDAATFTPGPGLNLKGSKADQKAFLVMVRREMAASPSFFKLMQSINADAHHPIEVSVGRNQQVTIGGQRQFTFVDSFDSEFTAGQQELDLADIAMLPVDPPADSPSGATQGELLAHAMAEAYAGAQGDEYKDAHEVGVKAENDYRDDRGQKGHMTPDGVERRHNGNRVLTFDNGSWETWVMDGAASSSFRGTWASHGRSHGLDPDKGESWQRRKTPSRTWW